MWRAVPFALYAPKLIGIIQQVSGKFRSITFFYSYLASMKSCALYSGLIDSDDWNRYIIMGRLTPSLPVPGWLVKKVDQWSPHRKRTELRLYGTYNAVER